MSNQQRRSRRDVEQKDREFEQRVVEISRVTRVVAGGKRMRFRATVVLGDAKGRVGYGTRKGLDVSGAVSKASAAARKTMMRVPMQETTIPHEVNTHYGAAHVLLKPAPAGRGVIAGGAVRIVMELAGVKDVVAKMFGSRNKLNNIKATFRALEQLRPPKPKKTEEKEKSHD
ncbi:MAG: 30S ribosomal protein S5 [Candidatus Nomurabacteria bacterium]|nr:MAG: 30S ribosomal protein S5 [Candidatus Nomurabacteria bacterium]